MRESRRLPVPEGLEGMRADAALAKLLGISRAKVAEPVSYTHLTLPTILLV